MDVRPDRRAVPAGGADVTHKTSPGAGLTGQLGEGRDVSPAPGETLTLDEACQIIDELACRVDVAEKDADRLYNLALGAGDRQRILAGHLAALEHRPGRS